VAIVGKPNAGKSTLLNALVGQKLANVTAKPQTTRHRILGIISAPGHQAVLVDTPGVLAAPRVALDAAMMRSVRTALTQADVLCAVIDASVAAQLEDPADGLAGLSITGAEGGPPLLVLLNKCDLLPPDQAERVRLFFEQLPGVSAAMCASAMTGEGVKQLEVRTMGATQLGSSAEAAFTGLDYQRAAVWPDALSQGHGASARVLCRGSC
jgi:GTP-binding protein Era